MIKIDEQKVNGLLNQHWEWFQKHVLSKKIKIETNDREIEITCENFIKNFFKWDVGKIEEIIKAQPDQLEKFADEKGDYYKDFRDRKEEIRTKIKFINQYDEKEESEQNSNEKNNYKEFDPAILNIFGYNDFKRGVKGRGKNEKAWGAYIFTKELGIDTCPYCNRQYIYTVEGEDNSKDGRPEIDHFFPEAEYPYLSCSLFNFIPSCHSCNHQKSDTYNKKTTSETIQRNKNKYKNLKPEGDYFRLLYPYQQGFSYPKKIASFKLSIRKKEDPEYSEKKYKLDIISEKNNDDSTNKKINNSIEAFHLKDLYNLHQLELTELVEGCRDYSEAKSISLATFLAKKLGSPKKENDLISMYEKKIKNIIFGIPRNTDKIYLLKQLKEDLVKQFELIDYNEDKLKIAQ